MNVKNNVTLFILAVLSILFLVVQCLYFLIYAYKKGKKLGIEKSKLDGTIVTGIVFSFIPSLAILATAIMIMQSLGMPFALTRMNFAASIQDNIMILETVFSSFGIKLSTGVTDETTYVTIVWASVLSVFMALMVFPVALLLMGKPKKEKKESKSSSSKIKLPSNLGDVIYSAIVAVFVAVAIAGQGDAGVKADGAGVLSVLTLLSSFWCVAMIQKLSEKFSIKWLENYSISISMLIAIGISAILVYSLPESFVLYEWRG
ncbi:MAG: DUF5058 family protein [Oscillospiraceae bacterium]|nr:DUF5058 family protein [Oscillospiraceae bacterium]